MFVMLMCCVNEDGVEDTGTDVFRNRFFFNGEIQMFLLSRHINTRTILHEPKVVNMAVSQLIYLQK